MRWYAVTDSDWDWDTTDDDDGAPAIVEADSPEDAARKAVEKWLEDDPHALDGGHLKVAELRLMGFVEVEVNRDSRVVKLGSYCHV